MSGSQGARPLTLEWLPGRYAVCRLNPDQSLPAWAQAAPGTQAGATPRVATHLLSITRTDRELSIVIDQSLIPNDVPLDIRIEREFAAMRIAGTLGFSEVGIISRLTSALAAASIPVFVISTFETDVLLVRHHDKDQADRTLRATGITLTPNSREPSADRQGPRHHECHVFMMRYIDREEL